MKTLHTDISEDEPIDASALFNEKQESHQPEMLKLENKIVRARKSVVIEQYNLDFLRQNSQVKCIEVADKKAQRKVQEQNIIEHNAKIEAIKRQQHRSEQKMLKLREKIRILEKIRDINKKQRHTRIIHLKKEQEELKIRKLLTQLDKQRNENDLENSYASHCKFKQKEFKKEKRIQTANMLKLLDRKAKKQESNRLQVLKIKSEEEYGR